MIAKLSPVMSFVLLEVVEHVATRRAVSASDLREMEAKTKFYELKAKADPWIWLDNAKRYRRELNAAKRERKLWLAGIAELKAAARANPSKSSKPSRPLTDKATREALSGARAAGKIGRKK